MMVVIIKITIVQSCSAAFKEVISLTPCPCLSCNNLQALYPSHPMLVLYFVT